MFMKWIWFKLGATIDITRHHISIQVVVTLTFIQGQMGEKKNNSAPSSSQKFLIDLDGIYAVETRRFDEPQTHLVSSARYSREINLFGRFLRKN